MLFKLSEMVLEFSDFNLFLELFDSGIVIPTHSKLVEFFLHCQDFNFLFEWSNCLLSWWCWLRWWWWFLLRCWWSWVWCLPRSTIIIPTRNIFKSGAISIINLTLTLWITVWPRFTSFGILSQTPVFTLFKIDFISKTNIC